MAAHNELGKKGEDLAEDFMTAKGFHILDRNYRYERAEIDLVALSMDPAELVFVEVKTRSTNQWGHPEEFVTPEKQKLIFKAADAYLYEKNMWTVPVRFDIIAITLKQNQEPLFHHLEDAFRPGL